MIKLFVVAVILVDAIALCMTIKDLVDEGKFSKGRITFLILMTAASIFVNFYGLDLDMPVLQVTADQKASSS